MTKAKQDEPATVTTLPESKRQKFNRIATARMNRALKTIELLSNLANRSAYEFTEHEPASMCRELRTAIDDVELAFRKSARKQIDFNFGGK